MTTHKTGTHEYRDVLKCGNKGKVLRITNTSAQHLHQVQVKVSSNPSHNLPEKTAVVAEVLAPHRTIEVGWIELGDRLLAPADRVHVTCHEYGQTLKITVQETTAPRQAAR